MGFLNNMMKPVSSIGKGISNTITGAVVKMQYHLIFFFNTIYYVLYIAACIVYTVSVEVMVPRSVMYDIYLCLKIEDI